MKRGAAHNTRVTPKSEWVRITLPWGRSGAARPIVRAKLLIVTLVLTGLVNAAHASPPKCATQIVANFENGASLMFGNRTNGYFDKLLPSGVDRLWVARRRHYEFQFRVDREKSNDAEIIQWIGQFCEHFDADQAVIKSMQQPSNNTLLFSCDCASEEES